MQSSKLIALALISLLLSFVTWSASAQDSSSLVSRLVGTWQLNEAKRQVGGAGLGLSFRRDAQGNLEERRGSDAAPLWEPVHFDGKPYPVDNGANTIVWKQIDDSHFERTSFVGGKLILTRRLNLSPDGKTVTEEDESSLTNGKRDVTTVTFERSSGEAQGLAGTWRRTAIHNSLPPEEKIEEAGPNRVKLTTDAGITFTVALDNSPVSIIGPAVISGEMVAWKQVDANTVEGTNSRKGVPINRVTMAVSPDGKTMTVTTVNLAPNASREPSTNEWDKK
jgi:hypothetical protein